ncbi:hypothetical protein KSS87_015660 [Heliosperma pusillum]|nr:hypothetical protein KSS87_015660 [Heliosperma pusillum]KAH9606173.1 hypothetical protein KSS87_015660 [Heliosperma pusillum]
MLIPQINFALKRCLTVNQAKQIHAQIVVNYLNEVEIDFLRQFVESRPNLTPSVVCYVRNVLLNLKYTDCSIWSCVIRSFASHGMFKDTLALYIQMQRLGFSPTTYAISSTLKSCARLPCKVGGLSIHAQVHKYDNLQSVFVQTAVMDFYAKLGDMKAARMLFDEMGEKNVVSWNSLLSGYLKSRDLAMAKQLFDEMPLRDIVSWNSMISGYARSGDMEKAQLLFEEMPDKNKASWNAMISGYVECGKMAMARRFFESMPQRNNISCITVISGYAKCGDVNSARDVFYRMLDKDVLVFNAMIACYAQNSQPKEAINLFNEMLTANMISQPDKMTLACVISACSQLGDLDSSSWMESYIRRSGIEVDDHLATALVDLYAKCGNIDKAYQWFHSLGKRDLVAYTAMISGCGINGKPHDAIKLFEEMITVGISPNLVTFTGVLTAYNYAGLVEEGYLCFSLMGKLGLMPSADHYGIMVDLLGRTGRLDEAYELIKSMPIPPHSGVWGALLLACRLHNNVELGEIAAKHCFDLGADTTGYSALLANIYATNDKWNDVNHVRSVESGKVPGFSWV